MCHLLNIWAVASRSGGPPLPARCFQQCLEGGRDQGLGDPALLMPSLCATPCELAQLSWRLSCHLSCVHRGTGAKFQPGPGEGLEWGGGSCSAPCTIPLLPAPFLCSQRCSSCSALSGCSGWRWCVPIRALGALVHSGSPAEQGNQTVSGQRGVVIE